LSSPAAQTAAAAEAHLADAVAPDAEEPYHRVVSAPSGRIGVTFVEYRGHAMVSDVADDSPLVGWIFPSDILIAIDELPVSGMKVRDIIQVLRDRDERQRALRVISSHAMNDLTNMNTSVLYGPS
jgi:C-terminal processing protease CtpA/Prc